MYYCIYNIISDQSQEISIFNSNKHSTSIINTSSSPFKVTHENFTPSTSQSSQKQINNIFNDKSGMYLLFMLI